MFPTGRRDRLIRMGREPPEFTVFSYAGMGQAIGDFLPSLSRTFPRRNTQPAVLAMMRGAS